MSLLSKLFGTTEENVTKTYRETKYGDHYNIDIVHRTGGYEIYARSYPKDPHGKGVDTNHKYADGRICTTAKPQTLSKAKAVAIHWMTGWSQYVRSRDGKWPRNGKVRVNVPD